MQPAVESAETLKGTQPRKKILLTPFHIRVKRQTDTYFVCVEDPATVGALRKAAARMMAVAPEELRLCRIAEDGQAVQYLKDDDQIADLGLRNDDIVCGVLLGDDGWETPCVVDFPTK